MLARHAYGKFIVGHRDRVADRIIELPDHLSQPWQKIFRLQQHLMVRGADPLSHLRRIGKLIGIPLAKMQ